MRTAVRTTIACYGGHRRTRLAGVSPVLEAFDEPAGKTEVLRAVRATNFIAKTRSRRSPTYTG